jgi:predicted metal-binding membrane protein
VVDMTASRRIAALVNVGARARSRPDVQSSRLLLPLLLGLILASWGALSLWSGSPAGRYLDHRDLEEGGLTALTVTLFVGGWLLMIVAMMLPTSLPLVVTFRAIVGRRPHPDRLAGLVAVAYVVTWTAVGLGLFVMDAGVHATVDAVPWLSAHPGTITAVTLLGAGAYQFSALKYHCLDACRSPLVFVMSYWRGARPTLEALEIGLRHAAYCIGCCWSLMLVLFALGMGNLAWMLGAGAVMAVEKNVRGGRRLGKPLGLVLLAAGMVVLIGQAGAPSATLPG